jgi:hypothetical protein
MSVLPWPADQKTRRQKSTRKMIVDPLPQSILNGFVSDIPGPKGETEAERAARFERQMAEIMSYNPRNAAEAMMATHCIVLRLLAADTHRDAARTDLSASLAKKNLRLAKQFEKQIVEMEKMLALRQARPLGKMDPGLFVSLGLSQFLIADPDDPDQIEEAVSATIVPLHPAPKMLQ